MTTPTSGTRPGWPCLRRTTPGAVDVVEDAGAAERGLLNTPRQDRAEDAAYAVDARLRPASRRSPAPL